jgi:hypothetical protein
MPYRNDPEMVKEEKQRVSRHKFGQPKYFFLMPIQQKSLIFLSRYVAPLMLTMRTHGVSASSSANKAKRDKVKTIIEYQRIKLDGA